MEAAKNRFVKIDGSSDLLQRSMTFACGTAYLISCENAAAGSVYAMLWYAGAIAIISVYMYIRLVGDQGGPCICIQA